MADENDKNQDDKVEPSEELNSVEGAAKKIKRAVRDTAQQYLDIAGIKLDLKDIEKRIRNSPYYSLALAVSAGFIVGGGLATTPGIALLGLFGRSAVRDTASNLGRQVFREGAGA